MYVTIYMCIFIKIHFRNSLAFNSTVKYMLNKLQFYSSLQILLLVLGPTFLAFSFLLVELV